VTQKLTQESHSAPSDLWPQEVFGGDKKNLKSLMKKDKNLAKTVCFEVYTIGVHQILRVCLRGATSTTKLDNITKGKATCYLIFFNETLFTLVETTLKKNMKKKENLCPF
jgi:hypothetical protein